MSHCSPKDVDDGRIRRVYTLKHAISRLVCSKRTVQALLSLYHSTDEEDQQVDTQVYFFPFCELERLSEWRCYIRNGKIVAVSQSAFYQCNHRGITARALREMVRRGQILWSSVSGELDFGLCVLDIHAEVHKPGFEVKLTEINPWGPYLWLRQPLVSLA